MSRAFVVRQLPRLSLLACALATLPAMAQTVGTPGRFTPVIGDASTLYPRSPASLDAAPVAVRAAAGTLDRIVVELDRDGVPADGQSPVHVRVQLLDPSGLPLSGTTYATIENSGGRIRLPGSRTDELGPGALDADKLVFVTEVDGIVDGAGASLSVISEAEA